MALPQKVHPSADVAAAAAADHFLHNEVYCKILKLFEKVENSGIQFTNTVTDEKDNNIS